MNTYIQVVKLDGNAPISSYGFVERESWAGKQDVTFLRTQTIYRYPESITTTTSNINVLGEDSVQLEGEHLTTLLFDKIIEY